MENDKYRNPCAPPGYRNENHKVKPLLQVKHNPDAPPGMYKLEYENSNKVYFPKYDFVIDLDILNNVDSDENLSDFVIQTSDEESDSSQETITIKRKKEKDKTKNSDKDEEFKEKEKFIKNEPLQIEEPDHLFGSYHCEVCNLKLNSEKTYEAHMTGKKHLKAVKAKNVADTVLKSIPQSISSNENIRYPPPPPGVYREIMRNEAIIQKIVEENLKTPCPGLYNVIEIQGIADTSYYCKLCDSPCSTNTILSHLGGYKHQLKCLKYFKPDLADRFNFEPKYKIEKEIIKILASIEKKEGIGRIIVEKEFYVASGSQAKSQRNDINPPSTSSSLHSGYDDGNVLDETKSGFYCRVCESHMNSERMWESHIRGKRHAANLKKAPGSMPSKLKAIPIPNAISRLERKVRDIGPIVGLDHIKETQNREIGAETYQCLLCNACHTSLDIEEHLLSQKHKKKYLQHINHPDLGILEGLNFHDQNVNSLIDEICMKAEDEHGRGHPKVFLTKGSL